MCGGVCKNRYSKSKNVKKKRKNKKVWYTGERIETVDLRHCKVKKMKSVKFEKEKKRRYTMKVYKIMSEPEDLTGISLFISHLLISFGLHSAPPLSRTSKMYFALLPNLLFFPSYLLTPSHNFPPFLISIYVFS